MQHRLGGRLCSIVSLCQQLAPSQVASAALPVATCHSPPSLTSISIFRVTSATLPVATCHSPPCLTFASVVCRGLLPWWLQTKSNAIAPFLVPDATCSAQEIVPEPSPWSRRSRAGRDVACICSLACIQFAYRPRCRMQFLFQGPCASTLSGNILCRPGCRMNLFLDADSLRPHGFSTSTISKYELPSPVCVPGNSAVCTPCLAPM